MRQSLADAYNNRGVIYRDTNDHDKAIADYTEAIRLDPKEARFYYNRSFVYEAKGDQAKAQADFTKAKELGYEPK